MLANGEARNKAFKAKTNLFLDGRTNLPVRGFIGGPQEDWIGLIVVIGDH
jgi:hypothetical protein